MMPDKNSKKSPEEIILTAEEKMAVREFVKMKKWTVKILLIIFSGLLFLAAKDIYYWIVEHLKWG